MADLVAVRHKSQTADEQPGLMGRGYYERFGKDKGYVLVEPEGDGLDALTITELTDRLPEGVTLPSGAKKADYIAAIRGA